MKHATSTKPLELGKFATVGLLATTLATCAACGRSRTYTGPEGEKTTVTNKGGAVEMTFEGKEGQKTRVGENVALPDDFPKDVAIYPKASVFASTTDKKGAMSVVLKIADPMPQVGAFYKEKLKADGWEIENAMSMGDVQMFNAAKEGRKLVVSITKDSEHTMATLVLEKAK